ncbi:hypothetical protein TL16_g08792 [Triparma laevis f. inornata]|uniref:G-protein coupled receptors family 3 profile domain-containing protein n=1 Tax=Triparma laevis f. inornata TaxID=1714386 RepID=A0A9W7AZL1_9STRA|nr:hypothetical protein TL16_g08792 [Triparma laevis f. inornata]
MGTSCGSKSAINDCLPSAAPTRTPTSAPTQSPTTPAPTGDLCLTGVKDDQETDIDCGGPKCNPCEIDQACVLDSDCKTSTCMAGTCVGAPTTSPTLSPTTPPTLSPTQKPTFAPTAHIGCGDKGCWMGTESCCEDIQANLFTTSKIMERILFFDSSQEVGIFETYLENKVRSCEERSDELGMRYECQRGSCFHRYVQKSQTSETRAVYTQRLPMSFEGGGHIDFSIGGESLYFSQILEEITVDAESGDTTVEKVGTVEEFQAQLGTRASTILDAVKAKAVTGASNFLPDVIQVGFAGMFVVDSALSDGKILFLLPDMVTLKITPEIAGCVVGDIASFQPKSTEGKLLTLCVNTGKVWKTDFSVDGTTVGFVGPTELATISIEGQNVKSIAINIHGDVFWVAMKLDDPTQQGVDHLHRYDLAESSCTKSNSVVKLEDVGGGFTPRDGISIEFIRQAPNGMLYASESKYGLPLIIDSREGDSDGVIGQTGAEFGFAGDTYSLAFSTMAYGKWCTLYTPCTATDEYDPPIEFDCNIHVAFPLENNPLAETDEGKRSIKAAQEYTFEIELKDAEQNYVKTDTELEAELVNVVPGANRPITTVYPLNAGFVQLAEYEQRYRGTMQVEKSQPFLVEPGDISHIHTEAVGSSVTAVAGENTTITIKAHDEFGNLKSKGGEMDKISVETVGYGSSHWSHEIEDMEDGTYQINVTAIKSGVYPIYMKVNGEDIKNAPFSVNVEAGRVDTTKSTVLGAEGVLDTWKVDDNVLLVRLKDEYDNKVVEKAQINNTVVEVGHGLAIVENEYVVERAKGFGESGDLEFLFKVPAYRLRVTAEKDAIRVWHRVKYCEGGEESGECVYLKYVNTKIGDEDEDGEKERTLDGETSIPPKHIELLRMPTDETYQFTQYVYGVVMLIMTIFFGLTIRWRNENAIKYSQKKILFVILWGMIVMEISCLTASVKFLEKVELSCYIQLALGVGGGWLVLLCVIAKSYRVIKLAYNKSHKRIAITDTYLLIRISIIMALLEGSILAWIIDNKVRREEKLVGQPTYNREGSSIQPIINQCVWGTPIYQAILIGLTALLAFMVVIMAFMARKIPSAFNEGKHIAQAIMALSLLAVVFAVNFYFDMQSREPDLYLYLYSCSINMGMLCFLLMMFVPKFYHIMKGKEVSVLRGGEGGAGNGRVTGINVSDLTKKINKDKVKMGGKIASTFSKRTLNTQQSSSPDKTVEMANMSSISENMSFGAVGFTSSGGESFNSDGFENPLAKQSPAGLKKGAKAHEMIEKELKKKIDDLTLKCKDKDAKIVEYKATVKDLEGKISQWEVFSASSRDTSGSTTSCIPTGSLWQEFFDDAGRPYYYHTETQVCQYERPGTWL